MIDKKDKIFKISIFFISLFFLVSVFFNQSRAEDLNYIIKDSYVEIQQKSGSQTVTLIRKENSKEEISGNFRIEDDYLISDLPENEFLEKYSWLKSGFKDFKIKIEVDQPLFKKENFYQSKNFLQKITSLFSDENLPDYRLTKEIQGSAGKLETNADFSDLNLKTVYEEKEGKIKQSFLLKNNSDREINFQMSFTSEINSSDIFFGGERYKISETPQLLSLDKSSSFSFSPEADNKNLGRSFIYDFSDLLGFQPEVWVFNENSKNLLLVKITDSISPQSLKIVDPSFVATTVNSLATAWGFQRKTWHDGSRHWVSFYDSTAGRIKFYYSATGVTWTENESAVLGDDISAGNDFSIDCDSTYCYIIYPYNDGKTWFVKIRRAEGYPSESFGWREGEIIQAADANQSYQYVHLARSSEDYFWATYCELQPGVSYFLKAQRSANPGDISSWDTSESLDSNIAPDYGLTVREGGGDNYMLAIWHEASTIKSALYDGSWGTATTVDYADGSTLDENISAVYDDTAEGLVHLAFNASGTSDVWIKYNYWDTTDSSWYWTPGNSLTIASSAPSDYVSISYDRGANEAYIFWIENTGGEPLTYYVKTARGLREAWVTGSTLVTSLRSLTWLTSNYFPYSGTENDMFIEYLRATTSGYEVNFEKIDGAIENVTPEVGTLILNGGNSITLTESTTTVIYATATVTDDDGYSDIASVNGVIYRSGVGSSCTANDNNCYSISSCATSSCSGDSCTATCEANIWFHADPTDAGSIYSAQAWTGYMKVVDKQNASSSNNSSNVELNTLHSLDVSNLYERYNAGDTNYSAVGGTTWAAQTFTIGNTGTNIDHDVISAKLKIGRQGSPGTNCVLSLRAADGNGAPTGTDLTSITFSGNYLSLSGEWFNLPLPSYQLSSSTKYALVLRAPSGNVLTNFLKWYYDGSSPTYGSGSCYISENSGSTWSADTGKDYMFEEFGSGGINYGTLDKGQDTGTLNRQALISNTGNAALDIYLYGTNMAMDSYSIGVDQQEWATSSLTYGLGTDLTTSTSTAVEVDLSKPTYHPSSSTDDIYWGLMAPLNIKKGIYSGTNTFEAKAD